MSFDFENGTVEQFLDYVSQLDVASGAGNYMFYQGIDIDHTSLILGDLHYRMIDYSDFGRFMNDPANKQKIDDLLEGWDIKIGSLWDQASVRLADAAEGKVLVAVTENLVWENSTFFREELDVLLANKNVTHINGISKQDLIDIKPDGERSAKELRYEAIKLQSLNAVGSSIVRLNIDGKISKSEMMQSLADLVEGGQYPLSGVDTTDIKIPYSYPGGELLLDFSMDDFKNFDTILGNLNVSNFAKLGGIIDLYGFALDLHAASELLMMDRQSDAEKIIASAVGSIGGAAAGSALGSVIGAAAVSLFSLTGWGAAATIFGGGLIGAFAGDQVGERLGEDLYEYMLNQNGSQTLLPEATGEFILNWLKENGVYAEFVLSSATKNLPRPQYGSPSVEDIKSALTAALELNPDLLEGDPGDLLNTIETVIAQNSSGLTGVRTISEAARDVLASVDPTCFTGDTLIDMWDGSQKRIADIRPADIVLSYDQTGQKVPGDVVRLFGGETRDWVELTFIENGVEKTLTSTPGHPFLTREGAFVPIADLVDDTGQAELVLADGTVVVAATRSIAYSAETADQYEQAYEVALQPAPTNAWATYNFEVKGTHTYVADGVCVHNRCHGYTASKQLLDALHEAGLIDDSFTIIQAADGDYIILAPEGHMVHPDSFAEAVPFAQAFELVHDFVKHVGDSVSSVLEDTGDYLLGALPGLIGALINGQDFEDAIEQYAAQVVVEMGVDTLARIFGLEHIPLDSDGNPTLPDTRDPLFFDTEIGSAIKGALVSAVVMNIVRGDELTAEDYQQLALNHSVRFVVTQALQTQDWATVGQGVTEHVFDWFDRPNPGAQLSPLGQAAAAGAVSLLVDLLDGGIEDLGQALGNAAVAAGTSYLSNIITNTLLKGLANGPLATLFAVGGPGGIIVGAIVSSLLGKLFGDLFTPPPPLVHIEHNEDGSITAYVTEESGGYIYMARDGQDDTIIGGSGHDALIGSSGDNELHGRDGNDHLEGRAGDDVLIAGAGADYVIAGSGDDQAIGGTGDDIVDGGDGNDVVIGGDGDDVLFGDSENDREDADHTARDNVSALGEEGEPDSDSDGSASKDEIVPDEEDKDDSATHNDVLLAGAGNDKVFAGKGDDYVNGSYGDDILFGQDGNDAIMAGAHDDFADGGAGDDVIDGEAGSDNLIGGAGNDVIHGDKMVALNDTPVTGAIRQWLDKVVIELNAGSDNVPSNARVVSSLNADGKKQLKSDLGIDKAYGQVTALSASPFAGAFTLAELLLTKVSTVESAIGDGLDGKSNSVFDAFMSWLEGHDAGLKSQIANGDFAYLASDYKAPVDDPETEANEAANVPGKLLFTIGEGDDTIDAGEGDDQAYGGAGNDVIDGGEGNDILYGDGLASGVDEDGSPIIEGAGDGDDTISGGTGDDEIYGGDGDNIIDGGDGKDRIVSGDGADTITGGAGADIINSGAGDDIIHAGDSGIPGEGQSETDFDLRDIVDAGAGNDTVYGEGGSDYLSGGDGNDMLDGGDGSDTLSGDAGNDTLKAGAGNDVVNGGDGDDDLSGDTGDDLLNGGDGDDEISAGDGDDIAQGGFGDDTIHGDAGDDRILGEIGNDTLYGGDGNDLVSGGAGNDYLEGGVGNDIVEGGSGADQLEGGDGNDILRAGEDNDIVYAGSGDDKVWGEDGNDEIHGNAGADEINAGTGDDIVYAGTENDIVYAGSGDDKVWGEDGNDEIHGNAGADEINAGAGNDSVYGGADNDIIYGGDGNDLVDGGDGDDWISAGNGDDTLKGGLGNDTLITGRGKQTVEGGAGNDLYQIDLVGLRGTIVDISGSDKIQLSGNIEPKDLLLEKDGDDLLLRSRANPLDHVRVVDQFGQNAAIEAITFASHDFTIDLTNIVIGSDGNDTINGTANNDVVLALAGDDVVVGAGGDDFLDGGPGKDVLFGNEGNDLLHGSSEDDLLNGGAGSDLVNDGLGSDMLIGGGGSDIFAITENAGDRDTVADFAKGEDKIDLSTFGDQFVSYKQMQYFGAEFTQDGSDTVIEVANSQRITVEDFSYSQFAESDFNFDLQTISGLTGTSINEVITGTSGADIINGGAGFDVMTGGAGADRFVIGRDAGDIDTITDFDVTSDVVDLSAFSDRVSVHQFKVQQRNSDVTISFGAGQHLILENVNKLELSLENFDFDLFEDQTNVARYNGSILHNFASDNVVETETALFNDDVNSASGALVNEISNGAGSSVANGDGAGSSSHGNSGGSYGTGAVGAGGISTSAGYHGGFNHTLSNNAYWTGWCNKTLVRPSSFSGTSLDDLMYGNYWNESIYGHNGDDVIYARDGHDYISAGNGRDYVAAGNHNDTVYGGNDDDYLLGENGNDAVYGENGNDIISGGSGDDTVNGGAGNDHVYGDDGNDALYGESGNDYLSGGNGHDRIWAGSGNDTAVGGAHNDTIYGQDGHDIIHGESGDDYLAGGNDNDYITGGDGYDRLYGEAGNDDLHGGNHNDHIDGGAGNDEIRGDAGHDTLIGGTGNDLVGGGSGNDNMYGGDGHDRLYGDDGHDTLRGDAGDDLLYGGSGNDRIEGGSGNDAIYGQTGADTLLGHSGNDYIKGDADNDTIYSGEGNDTSYGDDGNDTIYGETGSDRLFGGNGNDRVDGGAGNDHVAGDAGDDNLTGGDGDDFVRGQSGHDYLAGGTGHDRLIGDDGNDTLLGESGSDHLDGGTGNDHLDGGAENDTLIGGSGNDNLIGGSGNDYVRGDAGDDSISGSSGNDHLIGSDGNDTIQGDSGSDLVEGGSGDDYMEGDANRDAIFDISGQNFIHGGAGADFLAGGLENDLIYGGSGSDLIGGFDGSDRIFGGTNGDVIDGGRGHDHISGEHGNDEILGGEGDDLIDGGTEHDVLYGQDGKDYLLGGEGNDFLSGGNHNDLLSGDNGNDTLSGGSGADRLFGGTGNDLIAGGSGADLMYGGTGNDVFDYDALNDSTAEHIDVIADFETGADKIDLADFDIKFEDINISEIDGNTEVTIAGTDFAIRLLGDDLDLSASNFNL